MLRCKECGIEREEQYFSKTKNRGKTADVMPFHYWLKKCKICQGVKVLRGDYKQTNSNIRIEKKMKNNATLSKDTQTFLKHLKMKKGYVNMLDAFKLAHYFIETFGYIDLDDMEVKDQLILMYEKLLKLQDDNNRIKK